MININYTNPSRTYLIPNREPIDIDPGPLSAFIPKNLENYLGKPQYEVRWINIDKYSPIVVSNKPIKAPNTFPLVIHLQE